MRTKSIDKGAVIVHSGTIYQDQDLNIKVTGIEITEYPHQLKSKQINELNKAMNTVSKYESTMRIMGELTNMVFNRWLDIGQRTDTEEGLQYKAMLELYNALMPDYSHGTFSRDHGLRGIWNSELKGYDQYR